MDETVQPQSPSPSTGDALEQELPQPSPLALRLRQPSQLLGEPEKSAAEVSGDSDSGRDESPSHTSPLKRPARDDAATSRPFKRHKGLLNLDYLNLLNREIEDAAQRVCLDDREENLPPPSQLGLTPWSGLEKEIFFEAVARMGKDDLEGISARIGSKSVVEVKQYITLLEEEIQSRYASDRKFVSEMASYPAAVELSQSCCRALEETADSISTKQERREQHREEKKWGDAWDLTPELARRLDQGDTSVLDGMTLPSTDFFDLRQWLQLSREVFMNSAIESENWAYIDEDPPSIWATTLEDFHSLVVSVTRRLVQTTIFASMSRIRDNLDYRQGATRKVIRGKDVRAAATLLGMPHNAQEFWLNSARRLRLSVHDDTPEEGGQKVTPVPLTYDQVESLLAMAEPEFKTEEDSDEADDEESEESDISAESGGAVTIPDSQESLVDVEADEVLRHSAADFPETHKMRQVLKNRVATEQQQEQHADLCDDYASYHAELEMWDLLQKEPPMELPKKPEPPGPSTRSSLNVESIYKIGRRWREHTEPWSEWELERQGSEGNV